MVYTGGGICRKTATYPVDLTPPAAPAILSPPRHRPYYFVMGGATRYRCDQVPGLPGQQFEGPYDYTNYVNGRTNTTYQDSSVQAGLTYYYKVTAHDGIGFESESSNIAAAAISIRSGGDQNDSAAGTLFGSSASITVDAEDDLLCPALLNILMAAPGFPLC